MTDGLRKVPVKRWVPTKMLTGELFLAGAASRGEGANPSPRAIWHPLLLGNSGPAWTSPLREHMAESRHRLGRNRDRIGQHRADLAELTPEVADAPNRPSSSCNWRAKIARHNGVRFPPELANIARIKVKCRWMRRGLSPRAPAEMSTPETPGRRRESANRRPARELTRPLRNQAGLGCTLGRHVSSWRPGRRQCIPRRRGPSHSMPGLRPRAHRARWHQCSRQRQTWPHSIHCHWECWAGACLLRRPGSRRCWAIGRDGVG